MFSIATDATGGNDDILTQPGGSGGAKDINDFNVWTWKGGAKPQAKDDIAHAFAASYTLANGHTALYFAMDRFDNSGDATAGFWLVQDSTVGPNASGGFNGLHTEGDLLVVSDFSQGGAVSTINIFIWHNGGLTLDTSRSPAPCDPTTGNNIICGLVNPIDGVATGGWGFTDKSHNSTYLAGEFLEVGIDLTAVFPNAPCFTTFFSETRSSTAVNASGSDFTVPVAFPLCHATISKNCTGAAIQQNPNAPDTVLYGFSGVVKNDGKGTLYNVAVTDTPPANFVAGTLSLTQPVLLDNCGGTPCLKPTHTANYSGSYQTSSIGGLNHADATATTTSAGGTTIHAVSSTDPTKIGADWPLVNGQPTCSPPTSASLALTKCCQTRLASTGSGLQVDIDFTGTVCNTSSGASAVDITGISVTDTHDGTVTDTLLSGISLEPGACHSFSGTYTPLTCSPNSLADPRCIFMDTVKASGTGGFGFGPVSAPDLSATCNLCNATACPAP